MTRSFIVGVFDEPGMADRAIDALQNAGFGDDQIWYSGRDTSSGGFLAGLKSLFTGQDATTNSVADDLTGMGLSNEEAQYYANEYQAGHAIVAVKPTGNEQQDAMEILRSNGAHNYDTGRGSSQTDNYGQTTPAVQTGNYTSSNDYSQSAAYAPATGYTQTTDYTQPTSMPPSTGDVETDETRSLRLREEQLQAEKQRVQSGEVRLHKDVVTEQQTIHVPVTHEEVVIERRPASGEAVDTTPIGEGETIRVPVSEEQVNVTKTPVVTGEVSVGKRAVEETQQVTDTVKREEARLENAGDAPVRGAGVDVDNT
jgi:uncharacterized protein (TIGR02271 family)